jgi:hypothetical protein
VTAGTTYLIRVSGWSGAAGAYALTITGPACQSVDYTLTTSVTPAGTGSITLNPPGGTYPSGTTVTVMADAIGGWHFDHWTGDLGGATNPATVLMNRNKSVTAVFVQDLFTLTINVVGLGTVTLNPAGGSYPSGTTVQLTADASEHWRFSHWEDDLSGSANPATIVMDAPHIVTAVFELPGDLDCSGLVTFGDINPFVLALTNPATYTDVYPSCSILNADINGDGVANFEDINPFVERIVNRSGAGVANPHCGGAELPPPVGVFRPEPAVWFRGCCLYRRGTGDILIRRRRKGFIPGSLGKTRGG